MNILLLALVLAISVVALVLSFLRVSQVAFLTAEPTAKPIVQLSAPAKRTVRPTLKPTRKPTTKPSFKPTGRPSPRPTSPPTSHPTARPTARPTAHPTAHPTALPTSHPTSLTPLSRLRSRLYLDAKTSSGGLFSGVLVAGFVVLGVLVGLGLLIFAYYSKKRKVDDVTGSSLGSSELPSPPPTVRRRNPTPVGGYGLVALKTTTN
eukprot:gene8297-8974_t